MQNQWQAFRVVMMGWFLFGAVGFAQDGKDTSGVKKIGGNYQVEEIRRTEGGFFRIVFKSSDEPTGRFDTLVLESDHIHMGIEKGSTLRLSAQVIQEKGSTAEIAQVLLFLPVGQTQVPVWLLSRNSSFKDLRSSKYIEMHAPTSDYTIL